MANPSNGTLMTAALRVGTTIPSFNIPFHDMMAPVVRALRDTRTMGLITVARLEWEKFGAVSLEAIRDLYEHLKDERFTRLHLDHCPVIDEDHLEVDYMNIIGRAIKAGYGSVMVDGSRLALADNIAVTKRVVDLAHASGIPVEAELGAVLGHEAGPLPPYEELFASGRGFTDVGEAVRFVRETGVDWLSVAIGNIHGAITAARADKKTPARLNIQHLAAIRKAVGIPLVLHGGSGIRREYMQEAIRNGIAKINIGTAIRQPYEALIGKDRDAACEGVYRAAVEQITTELNVAGNADVLCGA
jgi:fructose-bisphosphate aldolase, class II